MLEVSYCDWSLFVICCALSIKIFTQTYFPLKLFTGFWPNSTKMILIIFPYSVPHFSWKWVWLVANVSHRTRKGVSKMQFHIWYITFSRDSLLMLFKLCPLGLKLIVPYSELHRTILLQLLLIGQTWYNFTEMILEWPSSKIVKIVSWLQK